MKLSRLLLTAVILTLFVSCGGARWHSDYEDALKSAQKKNLDVFLVFSGDDWNEDSVPFKNSILHTKEFMNRYSREYVLCNVDFSQADFQKKDVAEDATEKQKAEALKIAAEYKKKEALGRDYNLNSWPTVFVVSYEGFVLCEIPFDREADANGTVDAYIEKVEGYAEERKTIKDMILAVRSSTGTERAAAIDTLVSKSKPKYSDLFKPLIYEFPALDAEDTTGRLGFYELASAYYDSYAAIAKKEAPDVPFVKVIEKGHLSKDQVQEAWYMAAYTLASSDDFDAEKAKDYLEKSYSTMPNGRNAGKILQALQQMSQFVQMLKESKEESGE